MKSFKVAQITEVAAGKLISLSFAEGAWRFGFENDLHVEAYAGWNLYEHNYGVKLLVGARDLAGVECPLEELNKVLGDATCEMITFSDISASTQLQFLKGDDRLSLELLTNSATVANWKIIHAGREESDLD